MAFGQRRLDVVDGVLELVLGRVRRVVRELRLVGAHQVARGVDDGLVEFEDGAGRVAELVRKLLAAPDPAPRTPASCSPSRPPRVCLRSSPDYLEILEHHDLAPERLEVHLDVGLRSLAFHLEDHALAEFLVAHARAEPDARRQLLGGRP